MSVSSSVGDFDLNLIKLRKPLEFADGTVQDTAYTGDGSEDLAEVLGVGNDALGQDIDNVGTLTVDTLLVNQNITQDVAGLNTLAQSAVVTNLGQTLVGTISALDTVSAKQLSIIPSSLNNGYNPIVNAGDVSIVSSGSSAPVTLTTTSSTTSGIRIAPTTVQIGAGGTADTPSTNISFNSTANKIISTSPSTFVIQTPDTSPTPTLQVKENTTGYSMILNPRSDGGQYNPLDTNNAIEMVAWIEGSSADNGQIFAIVPHSATTCGIKMVSGDGGSPTNAALVIGCGGNTSNPSQRIRFENSSSSIQFTYNFLQLNTTTLPNTAGASSGLYLPVTINGSTYKIALLNN